MGRFEEIVDGLARWNYETYDSHYSMPNGLPWDEFREDDPIGAQAVYIAPARAQAEVVREVIARELDAQWNSDMSRGRELLLRELAESFGIEE